MAQVLTGHSCFQHYLHRMGRAATKYQCDGEYDTIKHTLYECSYWSRHRSDLEVRLSRHPSLADLPDIVCGPFFESLPANPEHKEAILRNAEETFKSIL